NVAVENIDVRDWNIMALRENMAIVGQEPILFNYTIGENIAYGKPGATQKEIEEAAREANIFNFVRNLPDGFNTSVGQKGGRLSGGQKQRVAIARALVRKPKLLLLDEATAALDSRSEKIVQKVLDKAAKERTTLTVAHRLSTIQDCDMIVVFKNGRIVERGTHDELLAQKGDYYLLVQQQSLQASSMSKQQSPGRAETTAEIEETAAASSSSANQPVVDAAAASKELAKKAKEERRRLKELELKAKGIDISGKAPAAKKKTKSQQRAIQEQQRAEKQNKAGGSGGLQHRDTAGASGVASGRESRSEIGSQHSATPATAAGASHKKNTPVNMNSRVALEDKRMHLYLHLDFPPHPPSSASAL
ncbi:hypothetical protein FB639_005618, partial [Coemansia asiatica]